MLLSVAPWWLQPLSKLLLRSFGPFSGFYRAMLCITRTMLSIYLSVRPSVHLSVTRRYCVNVIWPSSPSSSHTVHSSCFSTGCYGDIPTGTFHNGSVERKGVWKHGDFRSTFSYISETVYWYSFNGILIETYTRPTQQCHFEWPWMTLSDLAKYLMTFEASRGLSATAELLVFLLL